MRWVIVTAPYHPAAGPSGRTKSTTGHRLPASFFTIKGSPEGSRSHTSHGAETMLALVEAHANIDVIVFYLIASAIRGSRTLQISPQAHGVARRAASAPH